MTVLLAIYAEKLGAGIVTLGIESSADRSFYKYSDRYVNHQHQKTTRHLLSIEAFLRSAINDNLRIASPLVDFSDIEILDALLSHVPETYQRFSSCGGSNSKSKHCGRCDKCAFIYVLLTTTQKGRRLSKHIFRTNLLGDVDLYRPWTDARYKAPFGCIGERHEVWQALERHLERGERGAVVQAWAASKVRAEFLLRHQLASARPNASGTSNVLSRPLVRAANQVRQWIK